MQQSLATLKALCEQRTSEGNKVNIEWERGNDFEVYNLKVDNNLIDISVDVQEDMCQLIESRLQKLHPMGVFYSRGEAIYSPSLSAFTGIDAMHEVTSDTLEKAVEITVPKDFYFDRLKVSFSIDLKGAQEYEAELQLFNGPVSQYGASLRKMIERALAGEVNALVSDVNNLHYLSFSGSVLRSDFTEGEHLLVYRIENINYGYSDIENRTVFIPLEEVA